MAHVTKVAKEIEFAELRRLSTEKLIVWIIGKSKELGIKLTPEEVVLECWLINPDKHALRGYREFPCSRTVLKRVGEMKGKKGLLTGSEISGYSLSDIARHQYADIDALVRGKKVDQKIGHSAADRQISSIDEAPYKRLRATPAYEKLAAGHPEQIVETDYLYFYGIGWHTKKSAASSRIKNIDMIVEAFAKRDPVLLRVKTLLNDKFPAVRSQLVGEIA